MSDKYHEAECEISDLFLNENPAPPSERAVKDILRKHFPEPAPAPEGQKVGRFDAATLKAANRELASWAMDRWNAEVKNRPQENVHRRTLDNTWRQVYRYATGEEMPAEAIQSISKSLEIDHGDGSEEHPFVKQHVGKCFSREDNYHREWSFGVCERDDGYDITVIPARTGPTRHYHLNPDGTIVDLAHPTHALEAQKGAMGLRAADQPQDYPEDAGENGNYWHECLTCHRVFIGHKRRVECKLCAYPTPEPRKEGQS